MRHIHFRYSMLLMRIGLLSLCLSMTAGNALDCGRPPALKMTETITAFTAQLGDSSIEKREKAARRIHSIASSGKGDSWLYDTLISYALDNLNTYHPLKTNIGEAWLARFGARELPAICRRYRSEPAFASRRALLLAFEGKKMPVAKGLLEAAFLDPDSSIVSESFRLYGSAGISGASNLLGDSLGSPRGHVRLGAIRGLKHFKNPRTVGLLLDRVLHSEDVQFNHDFTLAYGPPVNQSVDYLQLESTEEGRTSLHSEAYKVIEKVMGPEAARDPPSIREWLRRNPK
jgi:hypothetical protein